jgi:hypothetical protein
MCKAQLRALLFVWLFIAALLVTQIACVDLPYCNQNECQTGCGLCTVIP